MAVISQDATDVATVDLTPMNERIANRVMQMALDGFSDPSVIATVRASLATKLATHGHPAPSESLLDDLATLVLGGPQEWVKAHILLAVAATQDQVLPARDMDAAPLA